MTNACFFDDKYFGIIGFFLRQLALDGITANAVNNTEAENLIKEQTSQFIDAILGQLNTEKDLTQLWIKYSLALAKTRPAILLEDEKKAYKSNSEFTHLIFQEAISVLFQNKKELTYLTNNLIKGVLNELNRVSRTHGVKTEDLYLHSLLIMLERIDEYVGMTILDKDDFKNRIEKEVLPDIEKLSSILTESNNEVVINDFLWDLIKKWRIDYIRFLEPRRTGQPQYQGQLLANEPVKSELVDELAKGLEEEVTGK